jgi:hypothetical protein
MDRLQPSQQLKVNDQLVSNNGLVNLIMQGDGNLVLYRTLFGRALFASNTNGTPTSHAVMQGDGNFVAYRPGGDAPANATWATNTDGHPGAWVVVQDDGNLVVYDTANRPLWAANCVQDFGAPTFQYVDYDGYTYNETSESWKQFCTQFPCFPWLTWPDYATTYWDTVIGGQPVVIQLWKGWCQKFLGMNRFPGGIGGEVGVYQRIAGSAGQALWMPFPGANAQLAFDLINPITNEFFFSAGPETTYWLTKWMNDGSYSQYQAAQGLRWPWLPPWFPGNSSKTPSLATGYQMVVRINGAEVKRW